MSNPGAAAEMVAGTPLEWTWDVLTPIDPTRFYPKYGPLPATVAVREQTGPWNVAGQSRTLLLSDGGHVFETITDVEPPTDGAVAFFAYELSDFQKVFKRLVDHARAEWTFTAVQGGTRVHWTYEFFPHKRWGWLVNLIVRFWWDPYMRSVLPEIVHEAERLA
jgi:hypothetical protein